MFKFLRKYNKWILAVGGVLLMITFLIPQAITGLSQQAGARTGTYATMDGGETVSASEYDQAVRELMVVQRLMGGLPGVGVIQEPAHWLLLTHEAEQAGLIPAPETIDDQLLQYYQSATGESDARLVRQVAVKVQGVGELIRLYTTYALYSDRRLTTAADRLLHTLTAQMVVLEAKAEDVEFTPTEGEIKTQFEAYRDKLDGEGELGFGYKLPNRLKLEWIEIPLDSVRKAVEASKEFDGVALQKHWRRNPRGTFPPVEAGKPVPEIVRADLLNQLTNEKMAEIAKSASDQLRLDQRGLSTQDGYLVLPPNWDQRRLDLQELAGDLQTHAQIDLPVYEAIGDRWLTIEDAGALEGVGQATTDKFGQPLTLAQLLTALKDFEPAPATTQGALVQAGVAMPPLKGPGGNLFVVRVTAAEASRVPESVDEVRDAVVTDLKRKAAYDLLKGQLAALEAEAEEKGMLSFALAHDTIVQPATSVYLINPFTLSQQAQNPNVQIGPAALPVIGADRKAIEAIVDYARTLPKDTPLSKLPDPERTIAVAADDKLAVVVAKLVSENPLSRELFASLLQQGSLHGVVAREERDEATDAAATDEPEENPFSFAALKRRHDFIVKGPEQAVEEDEADAASNTASAAATTD